MEGLTPKRCTILHFIFVDDDACGDDVPAWAMKVYFDRVVYLGTWKWRQVEYSEAKNQVKYAVISYLSKDEFGEYKIQVDRQRPIFRRTAWS